MFVASMGEGNTPLIPSQRIGPRLGLTNLWFKLETTNPSGSYKDRFIAAEMTRLLRQGTRGCLATSSGNTGSSLAAYCARYEVPCVIVVNKSAPAGKLVQMQAHGAAVIRVEGFVESPAITAQVLQTLTRLSKDQGMALVVSAYRYCPEGMAAVESLGRELAVAPGGPPDHVFVPVGSGGLYIAVTLGLSSTGCRTHAIQPAGCSTVAAAFERGDDEIRAVQSTTRVSGLSVPFDMDASRALGILRKNGGRAMTVTDAEVFEAQQWMLEQEGIYTEPAGATALAGLKKALDLGIAARDEKLVCLVTGSGFKDPDSIAIAASRHEGQLIPVERVEEVILARTGATA